ncbi:MAG: imidazole glycerol phosphate synthase subunit HisF [Oscillospiraceae bacterium]|nr:imidazole glycerol phosphate synthase subunit HisF [Oscillospiraceae bacterium]
MNSTKKIIPCLDIMNGKVVKGVNFEKIKEVADPCELARKYNADGADELVFYDITASTEGRKIFSELLRKVADIVTIPLTAGGGIAGIDDCELAFECGADKVSINSGAIKNPAFIEEAAAKFGSERIMFAMDVKRVGGGFYVFKDGGRTDTGIDAIEWARQAQQRGAGEMCVNSIDTDGVKNGFDLELLTKITKVVTIPIIASGGAGSIEHFTELFKIEGITSGLAASIFHYGEVNIGDIKEALIK